MTDHVDKLVLQDNADSSSEGPHKRETTPYPEVLAGDSAPSKREIIVLCPVCKTPQSNKNSVCISCGAPIQPVKVTRDEYVGEVISGRFKIIDFIDRGGMGEVYLAIHESIGQRVAVKFLKERFISDEGIVSRFINEAKSYARVRHPNAVTLIDYGQHHNGALYIITEFVEGLSLTKTIKAKGPFTPAQAVSIGTQICEVLDIAHAQHVIHRDLKPDNIMLAPAPGDRYRVKVLDFGIAKICDDEHGPMTETGAIFGTPEFMSPEQAKGEEAGPASDIYALGVLLYYSVSGKLPFSGKNKFSVLNKHIHDAPRRPTVLKPHLEIPLELEAVILKCLSKDPRARYPDARALYDALEDARDALAMTLSNPPARRPTDRLLPEEEDEPELRPEETPSDLGDGFSFRSERVARPPKGFADPHADTMTPDEAMASLGDLGAIDMAAERGGHLPPEASEDIAIKQLVRDKEQRRVLGAALAVGAMVLVVLSLGLARIFDQKTPTPAAEELLALERGEDVGDVHNVLANAQVLALLKMASKALERGELDTVHAHLQTTHLWRTDAELPERGRSKRQDLEQAVTAATQLVEQAQDADSAGQCTKVLGLSTSMRKHSSGLSERWRDRAARCNTRPPSSDFPSSDEGAEAPEPELTNGIEPTPADPLSEVAESPEVNPSP
ncbi:MAG: serine/threonine-protein kinase, partial [Myxococcota bacterium]